ncbi:MAG: tetratricopeptide repeat protein [Deltaproteobacteria bacterium]
MDEPDRERMFQEMIAQVPESPLPYFSLGRHYLELGRFAEAAAALERCVALQPDYAAALLSLGDARSGAGRPKEARLAFEQCQRAALAQNHPGLAEEAAERAAALV